MSSDDNDIVTILRDISNDESVEDGIREECFNGSMEITRLRSLRLTREEREAVAYYLGMGGPYGIAATLRGLLERLR